MLNLTAGAPAVPSRSAVSIKVAQLSIAISWPTGSRTRPAARLASVVVSELFHRIVDCERVGAFRLFGDDGVRSARHQLGDRSIVILDVQPAVGGVEQLGDFGHHPLLV